MKQNEIPKFGNLQGVRVLCTGGSIAGPVACALFAEQGADVIQIESTLAPDLLRSIGDLWSAEHRNVRCMALNIRTAQGEDVLRKLLAQSDILVESSKGGTWVGWGLSDEILWQINPKLVIVHVSGYGQTGLPEYVKRGSYDTIGQAFGGYMAVNGMPDPEPPIPPKPYTGDYISALFTAWAAITALYRTRETGKGESVDIAQYETLVRVQGDYLMSGLNSGVQAPRMGAYGNTVVALPNILRCKDGNYISTGIGGVAVFRKVEKILGLEGDPDFAEPHAVINKGDGPRAEKFVKAMNEFCMSHTAQEANEILNLEQIPCSVVMTYEMMNSHPHYQARNTFTSWYDPAKGKDLKGANTIPVFKNNPGRIFRGGPVYGMDNDDILEDLGFSADEIAKLYESDIVKKT